MFVLTPVSALHAPVAHPHYRSLQPSPRERYLSALAEARAAEIAYGQSLAREEAIRRQREEERIRRQHQEALERRQRQEIIRRQVLLDALRAQDIPYVADSPFSCNPPDYRYTRQRSPYEDVVAGFQRDRRQQEAHAHKLQRLASLQRQLQPEDSRDSFATLPTPFARRSVESRSSPKSWEPAQPINIEPRSSGHSSAPYPAVTAPETLKSRLESRLMNEYETEVRDTLRSLLSSFSSDVPKPAEQPIAADNGKGKQVPIQIPSAASPTSKDVLASLETIRNIDAAFHALSSEFEFPHDLDFDSTPSTPSSTGFTTLSDPEVELKMAYTSRNTPVRYYEHALSALLTQLDAVESFDNEDVRAERKKVVAKVEKALQELENEIGESLEKFKWRLQREAVSKEIVEAGDSIPISEDTEAAGVGANVTPAPLDVSMDDAQQSTDVPSSSDDLPSIEPSYSYQDSAAEVHPTIEAVAAAESQSAESASPEAEELSTEIAADNSADIVMTEEAPLPSSSIPTETIQPDHSILLTDIIVPDHDAMAVETTQYAVEPRESQLMESVTTDLSINASNEDANPDGVVDVNAVHCRSISPHISAAHPPVALTVTSPTPTTSSVSIDSSPSSPQLDTFLLPASSSPLQSPIAHDIKDDLEELVVVEELDGRSTGTSDREDGWSEVEA